MVLAALALMGAVGVVIYGYLAKPGWVGIADKTFWDYLELLIVPAALATGAYLLNRAQEREREAQEAATRREREASEEALRNRELELADQRAQDAGLQAYLDQISQLLLDEGRPLRQSKEGDEEARRLARARTLTVLSRLDGRRQGSVVRFLAEAGLINRENPIIALGGTRRRRPKHRDIAMPAGGLGEMALTLGGVKLEGVDLQGADLSGTDFSHVDLNFAKLTGADLTEADLSGSLLLGADLMGADLRDAILHNAGFQWANLFRVSVAEEELEKLAARGDALTGAMMPDGTRPYSVPPEVEAEFRKDPESQIAQREHELEELARLWEQLARKREETMPDGQKHEEWRKDKRAREEGGENE